MNKLFFGALLALAASSVPAHATIVFVTYTGTVATGIDWRGYFSQVGSDLAGSRYVARYMFDTARSRLVTSATSNLALGGVLASDTDSPSLTTSFTINGRSIAFAGSHYGLIRGANDGTASSQQHSSSFYGRLDRTFGDFFVGHNIANDIGSLPAALEQRFTYRISADDRTAAVARLSLQNYDTDSFELFATLDLAPQTLSIRTLSDGPPVVPEPASWALMITGFGLVGVAMRRRSAVVTA